MNDSTSSSSRGSAPSSCSSRRSALGRVLLAVFAVPLFFGLSAATLAACSTSSTTKSGEKTPNVKGDDDSDDDDDTKPPRDSGKDDDGGGSSDDGGNDDGGNVDAGAPIACAFNSECPTDQRCEGTGNDDGTAFCKPGKRGTGGVGADCKANGGNDCASSVCVENGSGSSATAYCSDVCKDDKDCKSPMPYCFMGLCWYPL